MNIMRPNVSERLLVFVVLALCLLIYPVVKEHPKVATWGAIIAALLVICSCIVYFVQKRLAGEQSDASCSVRVVIVPRFGEESLVCPDSFWGGWMYPSLGITNLKFKDAALRRIASDLERASGARLEEPLREGGQIDFYGIRMIYYVADLNKRPFHNLTCKNSFRRLDDTEAWFSTVQLPGATRSILLSVIDKGRSSNSYTRVPREIGAKAVLFGRRMPVDV